MLRESNSMYEFTMMLRDITNWFGNLVYGFGDVLYNSHPYFRYSLYIIFFILFTEFAIDIIMSFIFSFRVRRLFIFRPFSVKNKKAAFSELRHTVIKAPIIYNAKNQNIYNYRDFRFLVLKPFKPVSVSAPLVLPFNAPYSREFIQRNFFSLSDKKYFSYDLKLFSIPNFKFFSAPDLKRYLESEVKQFSFRNVLINLHAFSVATFRTFSNRLYIRNQFNEKFRFKQIDKSYRSAYGYELKYFWKKQFGLVKKGDWKVVYMKRVKGRR